MAGMMFEIHPSWTGYHTQRVPASELWLNDLVGDSFQGFLGPRRRSLGPCRPCRPRNSWYRPILVVSGKTPTMEEDKPRLEGQSKSLEDKNRAPKDIENEDPWVETLKGCQEKFLKFLRAIRSPQWSTTVHLSGFKPDDITVKVDDEEGVVRIQASRETEDGCGGFDRRESTKNVKLPEDVVPESVTVSFHPKGTLRIVGKRKVEEEDKEDGKGSDEKETALPKETSTPADEKGEEKEVSVEEAEMSEPAGKVEQEKIDSEEAKMSKSAGEEKEDKNVDKEETEMAVPSDEVREENNVDKEGGEDVEMSGPTEEEEDKETDKEEGSQCQDRTSADTGAGESSPTSLLTLDVKKFAPEQVSVKVKDNMVIVSALEQREEDGFFSLHRVERRLPLPTDVDPTSLKSYVDSEGVLRVVDALPLTSGPAIDGVHLKAIEMETEQ